MSAKRSSGLKGDLRFILVLYKRHWKYLFNIALGISDFNLRIALQTLLKEYCEVCKSPKENKFCSFLQTSKVRPRKKARKYLYAVGENLLKSNINYLYFQDKTFKFFVVIKRENMQVCQIGIFNFTYRLQI